MNQRIESQDILVVVPISCFVLFAVSVQTILLTINKQHLSEQQRKT